MLLLPEVVNLFGLVRRPTSPGDQPRAPLGVGDRKIVAGVCMLYVLDAREAPRKRGMAAAHWNWIARAVREQNGNASCI